MHFYHFNIVSDHSNTINIHYVYTPVQAPCLYTTIRVRKLYFEKYVLLCLLVVIVDNWYFIWSFEWNQGKKLAYKSTNRGGCMKIRYPYSYSRLVVFPLHIWSLMILISLQRHIHLYYLLNTWCLMWLIVSHCEFSLS